MVSKNNNKKRAGEGDNVLINNSEYPGLKLEMYEIKTWIFIC